MDIPATSSTGSPVPTATFWICGCCVNHSNDPEMPLVANRKATCPECGEPCSCPGCIAEDGYV